MSAETKRIVEGKVDATMGRFVEGEVEWRDVGVVGEVVDSWGDNVVLDRQDSCNCFDYTGGPEEVAGH